jgi:hypothetical protein
MKKIFFILSLFIILTLSLEAEYISYDTSISLLMKADTKSFPEADQVFVENNKVTLDSKCLDTTVEETYKKVLTERGKQSGSYAVFFYDTDYDTTIVNLIEVIKPDRTVNKIDASKILKPMNASAYMSFMNIYSETEWLLIGFIPNLSTGDIIHTIQTRITHKAKMDDNYSDRIMVENYSPYLKQYYELTAPAIINLDIYNINEKPGLVNYSVNEANGKKTYKWDIDNTPQIIYEPYMEQFDKFGYYISLTTIKSWQDISKWYYSLVAPHLSIDDAMKDTVHALIKDCKTKEEKIKKIFYWVAPSIRYLGVDREKGKPGFEPHDVTYTFSTRGGVCRDKSALLVAMLREAGIPSDPILIAAGYQLNHVAPVIMFNHAVSVSYDDKGNPEYFFDPTAETTKDFFPQYEEDCSYIIASEKGDDLKLVPVSKPSRNNTAINIAIKVNNNFSATGKLTGKFSGLSDSYIRESLMNMTPQKIKELVEETVTNMHPLAEVIDFSVSDPKDKSKNIEFSADFSIPNYINKDKNQVYIPFEASKFSLASTIDYSMGAFQLSERKYPFKLPGTFSIDIIEDLKVPFQLNDMSIPKVPDLNYEGFNLTQDTKLLEDNTDLFSKISFSSEKIHFSQQDFIPLKTKLSFIEQLEKLYIIGGIKEVSQ